VDDNIIRLAALQDSGKEIPLTAEDSIALAFVDRHAHELRYVAPWGRWMRFDDTRWASDDTLHVFDRVRAICREVATAGQKPFGAIASAKTVAAVERLARSDRRLAATTVQWDAQPWLFAAGDRTIDLRTGIDRAPDPLDYVTKNAACAAAPAGTPHPIWTAFMRRVTAENIELEHFLQRYVGYCCSGHTSEHAFVFAYGTGANGKSTFIGTIAKIFGGYATVADMNTFLANNSERHPRTWPSSPAPVSSSRRRCSGVGSGTRPRSRRSPAATRSQRASCARTISTMSPPSSYSSPAITSHGSVASTRRCGAGCSSCRSSCRSRRPSATPTWRASSSPSGQLSCAGALTGAVMAAHRSGASSCSAGRD
jgi:D5 N terminal like